MQEPQTTKMYFYFDESGSPALLGHHGKDLLKLGLTSKTFSVGYIQTSNPHKLHVDLENLRKELMEDEYLKSIPSIKNLKNGFHANKDCSEVREKVFKLLKNRIHLYTDIDIYFSEMGNIVSEHNMKEAIDKAIEKFQSKWRKENNNNIRIFVQQPSHLPLLQVTDYILWAVYRVFEKDEFRYFDFIKEKIKLVHDIFDFETNPYYGAFYTEKKQLEQKKWSPIRS